MEVGLVGRGRLDEKRVLSDGMLEGIGEIVGARAGIKTILQCVLLPWR